MSLLRTPQGRILCIFIAVIVVICLLPSSPDTYAFLPDLPLSSKSNPAASRPSSSGSSLQDRMALSEKAWAKSVEGRHGMASEHPDNPQVPFFPREFLKYPYTIWDFFPATWTCPHDIQRVGRLGDGGKWVCGMSRYEALPAPAFTPENIATLDDGLIVYSFGINGESSFEAEFLNRVPSARVWGYDFSVDGWGPQIPAQHRNRTFFQKVGLADTDQPAHDPPFYSVQTLMAQNNHSYIDILKIDIEGNEYKVLDSMMDAFREKNSGGAGQGVLPIGQVMIELHVDNVDYARFSTWWERLEAMGMRPSWLEINLMAVTLGPGKSDPRCSEYVWVNAKDQRSVLWKS